MVTKLYKWLIILAYMMYKIRCVVGNDGNAYPKLDRFFSIKEYVWVILFTHGFVGRLKHKPSGYVAKRLFLNYPYPQIMSFKKRYKTNTLSQYICAW